MIDINQQIKDTEQEANKTWNFHNSHNIMTKQPEGVMPVSQAKELFNRILLLDKQYADQEMQKLKEEQLKDLIELMTTKGVSHLVWVNSKIIRLKEELSKLKSKGVSND